MMNISNFLRNVKKNVASPGYLISEMSGDVWAKAEISLLDYNKTIITLCSSALVLSFSLISIFKVNNNQTTLHISWLFFLLSIFSGITIYFLKFIYNLTASLIERKQGDDHYKEKYSFVSSPEITYYFGLRSWMIYLSLASLIFFFLGFCTLILSAYQSNPIIGMVSLSSGS